MICPKCGKEFSDKVWRVHKERCNGGEYAVRIEEEKEERRTEVSPNKEDLLALADQMGIEVDRRWGVARLTEAINEH